MRAEPNSVTLIKQDFASVLGKTGKTVLNDITRLHQRLYDGVSGVAPFRDPSHSQ